MTEWTKEEMDREVLECARYGEDDDLRVLLTAGADANFADGGGNTGLHRAAANGHIQCLCTLKEFGANYVANAEGNFPAHWAAQNAKLAALQFLIEAYDVDMLAKNSAGRSVLTEAFASKDTECIEACLSHPSAHEDRLANFTNSENAKLTIDEDDADDVDEAAEDVGGSETAAAVEEEEAGVTHTFSFTPTVSAVGPVPIRCRELPIGGGSTSKSKSVLGEGRHEEDSTGLSLWPASLLLSRWLATAGTAEGSRLDSIVVDEAFFAGKSVMEVGCGCALPAIALAKHHRAAAVYATDLHTRTLRNAAYNVALNGLTPHDVRVETLDWGTALVTGEASAFPHEKEMDVVLASDLIYDRDVLRLFCATVQRLLKPDGHLLYVCPQSGRDGLDSLVAVLQEHGVDLVARVATPDE